MDAVVQQELQRVVALQHGARIGQGRKVGPVFGPMNHRIEYMAPTVGCSEQQGEDHRRQGRRESDPAKRSRDARFGPNHAVAAANAAAATKDHPKRIRHSPTTGAAPSFTFGSDCTCQPQTTPTTTTTAATPGTSHQPTRAGGPSAEWTIPPSMSVVSVADLVMVMECRLINSG